MLQTHYRKGIPEESVVSRLLHDALLGLQYLHKHQHCHRNLRASSFHIDKDQGVTLLSEFDALKEVKFKYKSKTKNQSVIPNYRKAWTDPKILNNDKTVNFFNADIYSFGISALELAYGEAPPSKQHIVGQYRPLGIDDYERKCPLGKSFQLLIKNCCSDTNRITSIAKLLDHSFFGKKCDRSKIKQTFGQLIRSTEERINSSFHAPSSFPNIVKTPSTQNLGVNSGNLRSDGDWSFSTTLRLSTIQKAMNDKSQEQSNSGTLKNSGSLYAQPIEEEDAPDLNSLKIFFGFCTFPFDLNEFCTLEMSFESFFFC